MAVGYLCFGHNPKKLDGSKTGKGERSSGGHVGGALPDVTGRLDKNRITWFLKKVKRDKPNFPHLP